jgi:hypothetical protein
MDLLARFPLQLCSKTTLLRHGLPAQGYQSSGDASLHVPFPQTCCFTAVLAAATAWIGRDSGMAMLESQVLQTRRKQSAPRSPNPIRLQRAAAPAAPRVIQLDGLGRLVQIHSPFIKLAQASWVGDTCTSQSC